MTSLRQAQQDWEISSTPHCKNHPLSTTRRAFHIHEFRQFGKALALLNWAEDRIEITKFETLEPGSGGATQLIEFLKTLADKYQVPLWGHARNYVPDPPVPVGHLLTKEELNNFYKKQGFELRSIEAETSELWYVPKGT